MRLTIGDVRLHTVHSHRTSYIAMEVLWLGYDGLSVRYADVSAVLFYHSALDGRIVRGYGRVPKNIRAVVVTSEGAFLPSSWAADELRQRLARWRTDRVL